MDNTIDDYKKLKLKREEDRGDDIEKINFTPEKIHSACRHEKFVE